MIKKSGLASLIWPNLLAKLKSNIEVVNTIIIK